MRKRGVIGSLLDRRSSGWESGTMKPNRRVRRLPEEFRRTVRVRVRVDT